MIFHALDDIIVHDNVIILMLSPWLIVIAIKKSCFAWLPSYYQCSYRILSDKGQIMVKAP
jgi:hypothetical protein